MYLVLVWYIAILGTQAQVENTEIEVLQSKNLQELTLISLLLLEPILRT